MQVPSFCFLSILIASAVLADPKAGLFGRQARNLVATDASQCDKKGCQDCVGHCGTLSGTPCLDNSGRSSCLTACREYFYG